MKAARQCIEGAKDEQRSETDEYSRIFESVETTDTAANPHRTIPPPHRSSL